MTMAMTMMSNFVSVVSEQSSEKSQSVSMSVEMAVIGLGDCSKGMLFQFSMAIFGDISWPFDGSSVFIGIESSVMSIISILFQIIGSFIPSESWTSILPSIKQKSDSSGIFFGIIEFSGLSSGS